MAGADVWVGTGTLLGPDAVDLTVNSDVGTLDVETGLFSPTGQSPTVFYDLAFDPQGQLWGVSPISDDFPSQLWTTRLWKIDTENPANSTDLGYFVADGQGASMANALEIGADGTFYMAGYFWVPSLSEWHFGLYALDPLAITPGLGINDGTVLIDMGTDLDLFSSGDLAFDGNGDLYMTTFGDTLVRFDLAALTWEVVGPIGFSGCYGLVYDPLTDSMWATSSGDNAVLQIDTDTGAGLQISDLDLDPTLNFMVGMALIIVDTDGDGVDDDADNCVDEPNADQADLDDDGVGDVCDDDADGDDDPGDTDCNDLDPSVFNGAIEICGDGMDNDCDSLIDDEDLGADCDGDGVVNGEDNCPDDPNEGQIDTDLDLLGDVCDEDDDGDAVLDDEDNCPLVSNSDQADLDDDGTGDLCDDDDDADGVLDALDICPAPADIMVPSQRLGKNRWADIDGDGVFDTSGNNPTGRMFTMDDTSGCTCAQIIEICGVGQGHIKFGCSHSVMDTWTGLYEQAGSAPFQCE